MENEAAEIEATETDDTEELETTEATETEETKKDDFDPNETPEESARKALEEIEREANGTGDGTDDPSASAEPEATEAQQENVTEQEEEPAKGPPTSPSGFLQPEEATLYHQLPKKGKSIVDKVLKRVQGRFTQTQQEYAKHTRNYQAAEQSARHVLEAVRPYYSSTPELARLGITEGSFVAQLVGVHQRLANPQTRHEEYLRIGKDLGIDTSVLEQSLTESGQSKPQANIEEHPKFKELHQKVESLHNETSNWQRQQEALRHKPELDALQNAVDKTGRYIYPELRSPEFLAYAKPLALGRWRTNPQGSLAQALKDVVLETRAKFGYSQPTNGQTQNGHQAKLPSNNQQIARKSVPTTARGHVAPIAQYEVEDDVPANETPEESARRAYEQVRRGLAY